MVDAPHTQLPLGLLAELTHRCPLRCAYCSNPLELARASAELPTQAWKRVLGEAADLGVLQVHFSGGEPMARADLVELVAHASAKGLYGNLITSGMRLTPDSMRELADAGLAHVQLSMQDSHEAGADEIAGLAGAHRSKIGAAAIVRDAGLPLTLNLVVHRRNIGRIGAMLDMASSLGAARVEVAHTQYHGWALRNRQALLPSRAQLHACNEAIRDARARFGNAMQIDYVLLDYHSDRPKACMGGWGQRFIAVTPTGKVLPCHAAESLPGAAFPSVTEFSLAEIWHRSEAFNRYRGISWMPETCQGCEYRDRDFGGCRCQAFALTGDAGAIDPVCALSPLRGIVDAAVLEAEGTLSVPELIYRQYGNAPIDA